MSGAIALTLATVTCAPAVDSEPTAVPGITVSVGTPSIEVPEGGVLLLVASVTRTGGFTGDAAFIIDGVPAGVRALASSAETVDGVTSALLAVAVDPQVATGVYDLTIRATAFGLPDATTKLTLNVDPTGTPVYTLSSRPISVVRGSHVSGVASISRGANTFNVPVTMSLGSLPAGVTATLYPETNRATNATLTVTAGSAVRPGVYLLTVKGVAPAMADRVTTIPLTVLPGP